ncbi:sulfide:quinone oxidoreductase, mitochondrial isoform X2 [Microplitis demolitor]|uniref:sulfide:quinone oxidoreductase, mitochondrial isoform X2 n=1 Tax=Microplitis demolitor TaxID=69319 RepID=UPI00235B663A|nr:sulfide:quinone oxidoreductase, mitochondrial isoform X2 [Microplitis demolitor]
MITATNLKILTKIYINVTREIHHSCKVLVIGGGTGGCSMAAKLSNNFDTSPNHVIVLEPSEVHYYQPMFTLIGGGLKKFESSKKPMAAVLPKKAQWIKDSVMSFQPESNKVVTSNGDTIEYQLMIVAMGLQLYWDKIPGLIDGLKNPDSQVCSIYAPETVTEVFKKIERTFTGSAVFTFPNTPVKCPGAPQKIVYLAEDYWSKKNIRNDIEVIYNTSLPVIFGVKKYADALWEVCKTRNIKVNTQTCLVEVKGDDQEAVFVDLKNPDNKITQKYSFLHVTPPMGPPDILKEHTSLTNEAGFLSVDPKTLQHTKYKNIYGLGDCTSTPNSKTMAAIASQSKVLYDNIMNDLADKKSKSEYNGYASCPLVTAPGKCILAEFDYNLQPRETFPVDQKNEYWVMFVMKKYFFPFLYWNFMLKGRWNGPEFIRKCLSIFKFNK